MRRDLQLERLYRRLYDDVRKGAMADPFGMDVRPYMREVEDVGRIAAGIYAALLAVLVIVGGAIVTAGK
jgi:hypothetical protein